MKRKVSSILIILTLVFLPLLSGGCTRRAAVAVRKAEKKQEKVQRDQLKAYEKAYGNFKERHMEVQSPEARLRIEENRKRADERALARQKKAPFWKRWFSKEYRKYRKYKKHRKL